MTDRELLDAILLRALDERFNVGHVTRWLELAVEVNAGNRDMFPNEIKAALRGRSRRRFVAADRQEARSAARLCEARVAGAQGGFCRNEVVPGRDYCEAHDDPPAAQTLEKALAPLREAFVRWCEAEDLVPNLTAPYGQAFEAGWNAAIREALSRV